ncbi:RagB/SusD family nutrient uptake outer membrane protein [Sphingobacterium sp. BIGb0165]|uniref:RagB/SusD family nutrient uptake outer membrane protein n=1 Tax=Sphingobacterium sp. BIGb0165 TaxID=2940615 RepID=UPI002167D0EF|nr:RagB/SusD family nutrient uptake outer membrane protein [Sphingobacterium sp. BIGb0165]MCS4224654.1 hypothetical protein [Sphingobacterium sp. BIGb0165]
MKKIIYLGLIACCSFTACNKFLDIKPVDKILETEVYKDEKSVQVALNGIYMRMAKPELYGGKMTMQTLDILGQYYNIGSAHTYTQLFTYKYADPTVQQEFETIWSAAYANILNVNNFIEKLQQATFAMDKTSKDIMLGEAIGMRAFVHLDMLRVFGPIPSLDPNKESIPYVRSASSKTEKLLPLNEVITNILADIKQATLLLENDPVRKEGVQKTNESLTDNFFRMRNRRMNYYAVLALKARAELYSGKKSEAYLTAKGILSDLDKYFKWTVPTTIISNPDNPDRLFSPEIIFGVQNDQMYAIYDRSFNPALTTNAILVPAKAALDNVFEKNTSDYRYFSWLTPTIGNYEKVFVKFQDVQNKSADFRYFQPLIRKSEIYLILTETAPNDSEALGYLNALRNNRGLADLVVIGNRITAVDIEFRKEFYGEGQLFFYNKRLAKTSVPNPTNSSTKPIALENYLVPLPLSETNNR